MGSPAIFNGKRTKLLTSKGLLLQNGHNIDNDGFINYISDSVSTSGWQASGAGITVAASTTGLPRPNTTTTGVLITGASGATAYAYYRFILDDTDASKSFSISFEKIPVSGYVTNDFQVSVYSNTASDYTTGNTRIALGSDVASVSGISSANGTFNTTFTSPALAAKYIEVRIGLNGTNTHAITVSNCYVGPGQLYGFTTATSAAAGLYQAGAAPGSTSGVAIAAGNVGQIVNFDTSSTSVAASASAKTLAKITSLPAGVWAIYGGATLDPSSTLTVSQWDICISTTDATENDTISQSCAVPVASSYTAHGSVGPMLVNISTPTSYFLVSTVRWSGSGGIYESLRFQAVRIA